MRFIAVSLLSAAILSGCGTIAFTPTEYALRDGTIPAFDVAGSVAVSNAQPSSEQVIVYAYMGTKLGSDLKSITEVMVQQADKELKKNGRAKSGSPKTLALKVTSLLSEYTNLFYWKSNIEFQATLGDGQVIKLTVPHQSGVVQQDLNGCIAEGVLVLFKDARVQAYLAK